MTYVFEYLISSRSVISFFYILIIVFTVQKEMRYTKGQEMWNFQKLKLGLGLMSGVKLVKEVNFFCYINNINLLKTTIIISLKCYIT